MNRDDIIKHLAEVEVSEIMASVKRLRARVQELHTTQANKAEIDKAFRDMLVMEERLSLHEHDRDWFAEALKSADN